MSLSRRDFLQTSAATAAGLGALAGPLASPLAASAVPAADTAQDAGREYYELRTYHLRRGPKERLMADYCRDALVPALRRYGTGPVGVFNVAIGPDSPTLYVLIPHPTLASFAALPDRLAADAEYRKAGAPVLDAPAAEPPYDRIESSLMVAFAGMPRLALPPQLAAGRGRLLELRRYESHSEQASRTKIGVFNDAEIAIFRRAGMHPVFFGQTLIGPRQPNLTYLLAYDDMAAHDAQWSAFGRDPEWRAIAAKPEFSDAAIVSSISNVYLRPTNYSQI
jgi:hypothetical protein